MLAGVAAQASEGHRDRLAAWPEVVEVAVEVVAGVGAGAVEVLEEAAVGLAEEAAAVGPRPCCNGSCSCTVAPAGTRWTRTS